MAIIKLASGENSTEMTRMGRFAERSKKKYQKLVNRNTHVFGNEYVKQLMLKYIDIPKRHNFKNMFMYLHKQLQIKICWEKKILEFNKSIDAVLVQFGKW